VLGLVGAIDGMRGYFWNIERCRCRRYCLALVADKYVPLLIVIYIEFGGKINAAKLNDVEIR
jgi:hypothetical protein